VNTEVILDLKGGSSIMSFVTNASAESPALKKGTAAFAIVKANSVIIGVD